MRQAGELGVVPFRQAEACCGAGMFSGMRAKGPKADLALVVADQPAAAAGVFTTNVMCAAPVTYCREVLAASTTARAVGLPFFK